MLQWEAKLMEADNENIRSKTSCQEQFKQSHLQGHGRIPFQMGMEIHCGLFFSRDAHIISTCSPCLLFPFNCWFIGCFWKLWLGLWGIYNVVPAGRNGSGHRSSHTSRPYCGIHNKSWLLLSFQGKGHHWEVNHGHCAWLTPRKVGKKL